MKIPENFKQKYSLSGESYSPKNVDAALSELFVVSGRLYKENSDLKAEIAALREEAKNAPSAEASLDLSGLELTVSGLELMITALEAKIDAIKTAVNDTLCVVNDAAISAKKAEESAAAAKTAAEQARDAAEDALDAAESAAGAVKEIKDTAEASKASSEAACLVATSANNKAQIFSMLSTCSATSSTVCPPTLFP